jgi:hypothetical protein
MPTDPGSRSALAAFHRAVRGRRRLVPHVDSADIAELRAAGFEPLDNYTGVTDDLGALWPEAHRDAVAETRPRWPDEIRWFVRSPWPALSLNDIFGRFL